MFSPVEGITATVDAMDKTTFSYNRCLTTTDSFNQCTSDRQEAKGQKGSNPKSHIWENKARDITENHIPIRTENWDVKAPGWTEKGIDSDNGSEFINWHLVC